MADRDRNGSTRVLLGILSGIVVVGIGTVLGFSINAQAEHSALPGHPATVERMNAMQEDIAEIKADVKELLRRKP